MSNLLKDNKELMKEYNYEKNIDIDLNSITLGSSKNIWWKCSKGHEFQTRISNRYYRTGKCPICSNRQIVKGVNDLFTTNPELSELWNYEKNALKPEKYVAGSARKVWWKCPKGHEWQEEVRLVVDGCRCPYCSGHRVFKGFNDLETLYPELMLEWDYDKNTITPDSVTKGSDEQIWWKCSKGHSWKTTVSHRTNGRGCPECFGANQTSFAEQTIYYYLSKIYKSVINRYKDLFEKGMELDIFIPDINVGIEYDGYFFHSEKDQARREKQKYELCKNKNIKLIRIRENGLKPSNNCDYAITSLWDSTHYEYLDLIMDQIFDYLKVEYKTNVWNDRLEIQKLYRDNFIERNEFPEKLLQEWNYEKNNHLRLESFSINSGFKAWWKCSNGHEWVASIEKRTHGRNCPYCSNKKVLKGYNDLETINPQLAKEWNYDKNKDNPSDYLPVSGKRVWWKCSKGHEWNQTIAKRNTKGCPYCSNKKVLKGYNDLETINPSLAKEWNYDRNLSNPSDLIFGSTQKVWWKCKCCNNEWQATISSRNDGTGCPKCKNKRIAEKVSKKVMQFSLDGNLIAEYDSATDAIRRTGIKTIHKSCRDRKSVV